MCTLTYLPTATGFIFTSNRDEDRERQQALFPSEAQSHTGKLLMPLDPQGGGTWILLCENGEAACLLNGAFQNHVRRPPYRKSRGRVIVESFDYEDIHAFIADYNFDQIEPFTLVRVDRARQLHEIRWDAHELHHQQHDGDRPRIWSSVTLYDELMRAKRQEWFGNWLAQQPEFSPENIRDFHLHGGEGDPEVDFRMTRSGGLQTLSLSCISVEAESAEFYYHYLAEDRPEIKAMSLNRR
ncbi:MAG: NRDE family protein [Cyclobacteriaceae bacterium]